jgi:hypothetical protein
LRQAGGFERPESRDVLLADVPGPQQHLDADL